MANTKRQREKLIQAWFDPADPVENEALEICEHFQKQTGMTQKGVIQWALRVLSQVEWRDALLMPASQEAQLEALSAKLDRLITIIAQGEFTSPEHRQQVFHEYNTAYHDLNAIESSMADRYKPLSFDDE